MKPFPPRNWHNRLTQDRELPLVRFCVLKIDPAEPVAINGFNAYVLIQKMAALLNDYESELRRLTASDEPTEASRPDVQD